jgi:hypothetical protein
MQHPFGARQRLRPLIELTEQTFAGDRDFLLLLLLLSPPFPAAGDFIQVLCLAPPEVRED